VWNTRCSAFRIFMHPKNHFVRHEYGSERVSIEVARSAPRLPFYGVLDHIRSAHNVGSMFRTADGARAAELLLCGYSPTPPHRHLAKTALGAVDVVPWRHCATASEAIDSLKVQGVECLALERTSDSVSLFEWELKFPVALVMGNEVDGLSNDTIARCKAAVHLPMYGLKNSLNVSVAFGIALYEVLRRYGSNPAHQQILQD
jgi:tRNA G18 (ribose-2'-O)-methylase SpoU